MILIQFLDSRVWKKKCCWKGFSIKQLIILREINLSSIRRMIYFEKKKKRFHFSNSSFIYIHVDLNKLKPFTVFFQYILAFFTCLLLGAKVSPRATLLPCHRFIGMVIFHLAVVTTETGLIEHFQSLGLFHSQEALIVNFTGVLLFLFAIFVSLSVVLPWNY